MHPVALLRALAFASERHSRQRRKDEDASPYINHPIAVARLLAEDGGVADETLLIAALLHDTIEDTEATAEELRDLFGVEVAALVLELTDDKALPKQERKRLQIVHAATASPSARQIKIADKVCNLRDILASPPDGWSVARKREYVDWAVAVVAGCRGVNAGLERAFDAVVREAEASLA
ncbi:MAG: HD domain-containing protein [Vicinamibacterales bacterium]